MLKDEVARTKEVWLAAVEQAERHESYMAYRDAKDRLDQAVKQQLTQQKASNGHHQKRPRTAAKHVR